MVIDVTGAWWSEMYDTDTEAIGATKLARVARCDPATVANVAKRYRVALIPGCYGNKSYCALSQDLNNNTPFPLYIPHPPH